MLRNSITDVWQNSKCTSGILRNSHSYNQLCWKLFILKLQVFCLLHYCKNCKKDFWGVFQNFLEQITAFQNSGWLLQISPKNITMSCLPCSISFKQYIYIKFCTQFLTLLVFKLCHEHGIKTLISRSCYLIR